MEDPAGDVAVVTCMTAQHEHAPWPSQVRSDDAGGRLDEGSLAATWDEQLSAWLSDAVAAGLAQPNAMVLATADADGRPSSRTVLAKQVGPDGVTFFTNLTSRKGHDVHATRFASATFPWYGLHRQVSLRGRVELVDRARAREYWNTRPRGSQLGAWASAQSSAVRSRRFLDDALERVSRRFAGTEQVPLPPHWGGVRIRPDAVEFWQGRPNRMHDRLCYVREGDGRWTVQRLAP